MRLSGCFGIVKRRQFQGSLKAGLPTRQNQCGQPFQAARSLRRIRFAGV
nr:MAG TPA: hypothetical protein [Inoviridae sp.]